MSLKRMAKRSKKIKVSPQASSPKPVSQPEPIETGDVLPSKSAMISWKVLLQAAVIIGAGLWIYWPALHGDWLWDDSLYISDNPLLKEPDRLWKAWFSPGSFIEYYPIEQSVQWLQWQLWGTRTLGYHLTNLALHLVSSLLVWRLLSKFGLRLAWLGGLLFAVHPVQVESVAWISEFKNTLSLPPFLLAMCAWVDYEEHHRPKDYGLALGLFLAAMLGKITMAPFPVIMLLYAWWKRGRVGWTDLKVSGPFFIISLVLAMTSIWAGMWYSQLHHFASTPPSLGGVFSRLALAGLTMVFYFSKCFLPVGLLPIYPQWTIDPPSLWQFLPWPILVGVLYWLWKNRQGWGRHALLGLGFFLLSLAPFLGLKSVSYMNFTWVMDHFLYIPIIGLIGLVVAGLGKLGELVPSSFHLYGMGATAAVITLLAWESHSYAGLYIGDESLWTYTVQHNPQAWLARYNLGTALVQTGSFPEAMEQFEKALEIKPDYAGAHNNLGYSLMQEGQPDQAIPEYEKALAIDPNLAEGHYNLGVALLGKGKWDEAIAQFTVALDIRPDYADANSNLGVALYSKGQIDEAISYFQKALQNNPDQVQAHRVLGKALLAKGQVAEAITQLQTALTIDPNSPQAHRLLGIAFMRNGQVDEGVAQFQEALRLKPDFAEAQKELAEAQAIQQQRQSGNK